MVDKHFVTKVPHQSSEIIDLATRKSGLDFLIEYNDMVRSLRKQGVEWTLKHNGLAHKFCKRGLNENR